MSNPWTPGPWVPSCRDVMDDRPIGDSGLRFWAIEHYGNDKYRGKVCSVFDATNIGGITIEERNANARLIAEAPAMAEALEDIEGVLAFHEGSARPEHEGAQSTVRVNGEDLAEMLAKARAILARIKGEVVSA